MLTRTPTIGVHSNLSKQNDRRLNAARRERLALALKTRIDPGGART
jgi:hypothetical protein